MSTPPPPPPTPAFVAPAPPPAFVAPAPPPPSFVPSAPPVAPPPPPPAFIAPAPPVAPPAPPVPSHVPPLPPPVVALPELIWDEPSDETVVVRRTPKAAPWFLVLDSGRRIRVEGAVLLGRGAAADERWPDAELVHITDPTKTMSKTHTLVEADGDTLWFTDLDSTNGMSIARGEHLPVQLVSGARESAAAGDSVHLGQFVIRIEREPLK